MSVFSAAAMQRANVITDDSPDDRTAEQQSIFVGEWPAGGLGVLCGLIGDDLGCAATKINNLSPVKIAARQAGAAGAQLCGAIDAE